jgi:hypothetical protein
MSFAKYCVIYKEFTPTITLNGRNLSRTYKTFLRSFPHFLGSTNQIPTVHTRLPWEAFLIFWDPQIKSQPYIQDFLEKLSSFFGIHKSNPNRTYKTSLRSFPHFLESIYKSNPNRTYRTSLRSFHHLLGSIYRRSDLNCRYKTFLRRFHHLRDRFTTQILTIQVWLPLEVFHQP